MKRPVPLATRILVVLGISLAISGLIAGAYGAKPYTVYTGAVNPEGAGGVALLVFSLSSNGVVEVTVTGARQVLYVSNLSGDPLSVLRALSVFNIQLGDQDLRHDVRAGLITGYATLNASQALITALPRIAGILDFNIVEAEQLPDGSFRVNSTLRAASGILLIIYPGDGPIEYRIEYRLEGYERLSPEQAGLLGGGLVALGVLIDLAGRKRLEPLAASGEGGG